MKRNERYIDNWGFGTFLVFVGMFMITDFIKLLFVDGNK